LKNAQLGFERRHAFGDGLDHHLRSVAVSTATQR
jgi:hypothetical protein